MSEREAFEAAMSARGRSTARTTGDEYSTLAAEVAWAAWQDRAALASAPAAQGDLQDDDLDDLCDILRNTHGLEGDIEEVVVTVWRHLHNLPQFVPSTPQPTAPAPAAKPVVYPDADLSAGLSTDGVLVCGSPESIKRVGQWHHAATAVVPYLQAELAQARIDAKQPTAPAADVRESEDAARLAQVRTAINRYHLALDDRAHGGLAAHTALESIQQALGMPWIQGAARASKGGTHA